MDPFQRCKSSGSLPSERWRRTYPAALRSNAGRMNVGEVNAPLLPSRGDEVSTDETQHAFAMPYGCAAEQNIGLIDAVNRSVCWHLATDDMAVPSNAEAF